MTVTINGTTGVAGVEGTAATPAIQGNDTNTGIFFPAADTISASTSGTERLRIDSSGNLGVGTTSTSTAAVQPCLFLGLGNSAASYNSTVRLVGYSSTAQLRYTFNHAGAGFGWGIGSSGGSDFIIGTVADGSTGQVSAERMRIDSSGNLLVGTTSIATFSARLNLYADAASVDTNMHSRTNVSTNKSHIIFGNATSAAVGSIQTNGSATSYNTSSDYRLKENVAPMTGALAVVGQLKPVTYTWKADGSDGQGFIAHELQEVCPDAVSGEKDAVNEDGSIKAQGIDTSFLVATLTAAIKEQQAIITDLKSRIEALEQA